MNELSISSVQLPDTIEDLSKFALIGREKLTAVRAEIRAINKVGLAKEVHEQKLREAQEIAEAVLDAEVKIGELLNAIPKESGGDKSKIPTAGSFETRKQKAIKEIGITHPERYQVLAKHPEKVEAAKEVARKLGDIVTRQDVINKISADKPNPKPIKQQAKERHEEFKKNENKIVSISETRADRCDQKIIALELIEDIRKVSMTIERINDSADYSVCKTLSNKEVQDAIINCTRIMNQSEKIRRELLEFGKE